MKYKLYYTFIMSFNNSDIVAFFIILISLVDRK